MAYGAVCLSRSFLCFPPRPVWGAEVGARPFCLSRREPSSSLDGLVLAGAIWSGSQTIKPFILGNSKAVREEEGGGGEGGGVGNSRFRFTSNQHWNSPCYIINPKSHVRFHLLSLNDFYKLHFPRAARPATRLVSFAWA